MKKGLSILVFILSAVSLVLSIVLFYNMGIFTDEFSTSPDVVCGGEFWLYMDWLRLFLLAAVTLFSGMNLIRRSRT